MARTKKSLNWDIIVDFMKDRDTAEIDPEELVDFAISTGRYQDDGSSLRRACKRDLTNAMRDRQHTDRQGRRVRTMAAVRLKDGERQRSLWFDALEAKPKRMHLSLSQERRNIVARCRRHKARHESYNDNNQHGAQIPLFDYNINRDLAEEQLPTEYPDDAPDGESHSESE